MPAARRLTAFALALAFALGCTGSPAEERELEEARQREWAWLEATQKQLAAKRQEAAALRQQVLNATAPETPAVEGQPPPAGSRAELDAKLLALETELRAQAVSFGRRLAAYLNKLPAGRNQEQSPLQKQALRMKSDEDIAIAQEWIDKGGDYRRAIEIYETQLSLDPGYDRLEQALARAQQMRYVTAERFAKVTNGMTPAEVLAVLGPVNLHNAHEYPEQRILAWYYPREGAGASGVYFRPDDERDVYVVYQTTFEVQRTEHEAAAD
jgi:hypothetical protein